MGTKEQTPVQIEHDGVSNRYDIQIAGAWFAEATMSSVLIADSYVGNSLDLRWNSDKINSRTLNASFADLTQLMLGDTLPWYNITAKVEGDERGIYVGKQHWKDYKWKSGNDHQHLDDFLKPLNSDGGETAEADLYYNVIGIDGFSLFTLHAKLRPSFSLSQMNLQITERGRDLLKPGVIDWVLDNHVNRAKFGERERIDTGELSEGLRRLYPNK